MAKIQKLPSEMSHKAYVKYLATLEDTKFIHELKTTDRWYNKPFIREAYTTLDEYKKQLFVKTAARDYFYNRILKRFYPFELIYDVLQYKVDKRNYRDIWYYLKDILKHVDHYRFLEILQPQLDTNFLDMFSEDYHYSIFSDLLDKKTPQQIVVKRFKDICSNSVWYINYYGKDAGKSHFRCNFNDTFREYFNVEDYKMNPKCLYCLLLFNNDFLTKEEYSKVLQYLKITITYERTHIREFNFNLLTEEEQKAINGAIVVKQLAT